MAIAAPPSALLLDLLMAVMHSLETWGVAAGDEQAGIAWRDAVTARMIAARRYVSYERLVADEARATGLPPSAPDRLAAAWLEMRPWPDAAALRRISVPFALVTNCSARLANEAASRSGLTPRFVLSAEVVGWYKPQPEAYLQACARLGSVPGETLFVAGAAYDAVGAEQAGLRSRLVLRRPLAAALPPGVTIATNLGAALAGLP